MGEKSIEFRTEIAMQSNGKQAEQLLKRLDFQTKLAHQLGNQLGEAVNETASLRVRIEQLERELDGANAEIARLNYELREVDETDDTYLSEIDDELKPELLSEDETNIHALRRIINERSLAKQSISDIVGRLNVMAKELKHPVCGEYEFDKIVSILQRLKEVVFFYTHGHVHDGEGESSSGTEASAPEDGIQISEIQKALDEHNLWPGLATWLRVVKVIEEREAMNQKLADVKDILSTLTGRMKKP